MIRPAFIASYICMHTSHALAHILLATLDVLFIIYSNLSLVPAQAHASFHDITFSQFTFFAMHFLAITKLNSLKLINDCSLQRKDVHGKFERYVGDTISYRRYSFALVPFGIFDLCK